ncbi:MAG TPA: flagellar basal-body MS-ring/collar protein FliF, partial [Polyangiaceae bacterium]
TYLFTDLTQDDAAAMAAKLKELKVPYRVSQGGAIEVPEERVHELRLEMAGAGLPRGGGIGFEIFDKSHLGATEFEQRINLRRALEGELARTISTIASVQGARVHLVMPEHSVFAIGKQEASASVVLKLRPGRPFGKGEVASVVHLVSSAVPGLSAERVSVVSADGLMLHRPTSDGEGSGTSLGDTEADRERALASGLEDQAKALLERVVGPGHADVRIGLTLDAAQHDRTEEHYEPSKTALRSEQKSDERSSPEGPSVAGVPGAPSNLPDGTAQPTTGPNGGGASARTSWTRNWEVDRVTEHTTTPAGRVNRLSVAILVDGNYETSDNGKKTFVARDKPELDRLAELVKGAVGYTAERGDFMEIECAPFASAADLSETVAAPTPFSKKQLMYMAAAAAAFVLILAIAIFVLVRRAKAKAQAAQAALPAHVAVTKLTGVSSISSVLGATETAPALPTAPLDRSALRAQAIEIASRDPATAAIILRGWLGAPSSTAAARNP